MIVPVILSGGAGTRLWPLSTDASPKQFLPLVGETSLLQQTIARVARQTGFAPPLLVGAARHAELAATELANIPGAAMICEPVARNTAPAIIMAALAVAAEHGPASQLLVMPSDHVMTRPEALLAAVRAGSVAADANALVTFGITPSHPETGYGYLELGGDWADAAGVRRVIRFVEKPELARAEAMVAGGQHLWNAGIFLFRADALLNTAKAHAPEMAAAAEAAILRGQRNGIAIHPDEAALTDCPSDSIDYALMERADNVAAVPVDPGWSDLGSWDALAELGGGDEATVVDGSGNYVRAAGRRVAMLGVSDLIVVAHGDDILILPRGRTQEVKRLREAMKPGD
jgi:mannose-1-phosphate guanylyltransferase/mannose-6-phosphate isomerase